MKYSLLDNVLLHYITKSCPLVFNPGKSVFDSSIDVSISFVFFRKILAHPFTMLFILIQLLKELLQPFHLMYSSLPFVVITFSTQNSVCLVLCVSFLLNVPTISFPLRSLITHIHYFLDHKDFLRSIWSVVFCKYIFVL